MRIDPAPIPAPAPRFADFLRAENRVEASPHADPLAPAPFWQFLQHDNLKRPLRRAPEHAIDVLA